MRNQPKMPIHVEIKCLNKTDRYDADERIKNVGGIHPEGGRWKLSQQDTIAGIESGKRRFFVSVPGKTLGDLVAISCFGRKSLKTENDGDHPNNRLSLPERP
jgi:hypothetical protein